MFRSEVKHVGELAFPEYSGARVIMMPFRLEDVGTLPPLLEAWRPAVASLVARAPERVGVGYLTVDEAEVGAGEHHRRPGLHVDGCGGWGPVSPWASQVGGMLVAASVMGSRAWRQSVDGVPGEDGDCEHLASQLDPDAELALAGGQAYWMGPLAVHETLAQPRATRRQFVRLSMPSTAPWYDGYTRNPMGVQPTGPILPARTKQMSHRL